MTWLEFPSGPHSIAAHCAWTADKQQLYLHQAKESQACCVSSVCCQNKQQVHSFDKSSDTYFSSEHPHRRFSRLWSAAQPPVFKQHMLVIDAGLLTPIQWSCSCCSQIFVMAAQIGAAKSLYSSSCSHPLSDLSAPVMQAVPVPGGCWQLLQRACQSSSSSRRGWGAEDQADTAQCGSTAQPGNQSPSIGLPQL